MFVINTSKINFKLYMNVVLHHNSFVETCINDIIKDNIDEGVLLSLNEKDIN